ncbi:DUF2934 domain-containing protein [Pararhizobium sp. YC-54]|uniref:DUF2934 domain-containing protein n=1 Tax=Pararhizobium sp. YC-54 TaxID=2986920 RepID=UPI0021F789CA|nr:DUF2934 domain-containing protein [Pararhizobium sp. YC-54]MCW0001215.1 DUF2934 domain-containing protein [Pararhizobium sp. YC-54]
MENDRETRIRQRAYQLWQDEGSPEGKHEEHWAQAAREIDSGDGEIAADNTAQPGVIREAVREHTDAFIVASDLEDADQRESSPGTREQR